MLVNSSRPPLFLTVRGLFTTVLHCAKNPHESPSRNKFSVQLFINESTRDDQRRSTPSIIGDSLNSQDKIRSFTFPSSRAPMWTTAEYKHPTPNASRAMRWTRMR